MTTLMVLAYVAIGIRALPKIVRGLAADLLNASPVPLDRDYQFACLFFGLMLSVVWPLPALFSILRHAIFTEGADDA